MAISLIEAAKLKSDPLQRGVIMCFPQASPVLEMIPFLSVNSDTYRFNRADSLPRSDFRALNESYTEGTSSIDHVTESLTISGGFSDVDRALVKTQGNINDLRAIHDALKAKSCALKWQKTFFKGDVEASPKEFDGLQTRLIGDNLIDAGTSSGGDALTLTKLDELLDAVDGGNPDALFMNKTMRRRLTAAARSTSVGGNIDFTLDSFGRRVTTYNDCPIRLVEEDENGDQVLGFDEACTTGSSVGTSIYAVKFGLGTHCFGLQCGEMDVIDMGLYSGGVKYRTLIEWISGFTLAHNKSAARLRYIKDAVVAA